jgi:PAS domain S-box-containing protein
MSSSPRRLALNISVAYAGIAGAWIFISDRLLATLIADPLDTISFQTIKGLAFVALTSVVLFVLLEAALGRWEQDASERRRAEQQVREDRERLHRILDSLFVFVGLFSPQGALVEVNRASLDTAGLEPEDVIGKPFETTFWWAHSPTEQARVKETLQRAARGETVREVFEARVLGESTIIVDALFSPLRSESGAVVEIVASAVDITERKRTEDALRESEERLRELQKMEAIGQLAGGVAHDFNNILTVIQGHASLLEADHSPKNVRECARQIAEGAERAAALTRQLLLFSRRQVMQPATINLNDVVGALSGMFERVLARNILLETVQAPDLPWIHADAGMIEQVLINLVVNSRDAMPAGGRLTVATTAAHISETDARRHPDALPGPWVRLSVSDTGNGIAPDLLPKIFEPFFTTKNADKGTGLGLATAYGIVKQHHGWIEVASDVGRGTTIDVYLPARSGPPAATANPVAAAQAVGGTETILVVEDDPEVRTLVVDLLRRLGYTVLQAESGQAAVGLWNRHKSEIRLVLTDLVMPGGMNGREVAERLQTERPDLRIVYTSGYSSELAEHRTALAPGVPLLQKPYRPARLAEVIRESLDTA